MKINPIFLFGGLALVVVAILFFSIHSFENAIEPAPHADVSGFRKIKNQVLKAKVGAPFYNDATFDSLSYFPENQSEVYVSDFFPAAKGESLDLMPDRPGYASHMVKGFVVLEKQTWRDTLFVLKDLEEQSDTSFFVPFSDLTNGKTTYGGGRYLDLVVKKGRPVTINFNFAYNPWCAYKAAYVCARTPGFNRLSKAIEAGEKEYLEGHATP